MNITANYSNYAYRANQASSRAIISSNNQNISFSGFRNKKINNGEPAEKAAVLAVIVTILAMSYCFFGIRSQRDEKVTGGIKQGNSIALPLSERAAKIMEEGCLKDVDSFIKTEKNKAGQIISTCIKKK